MAFAGGNATATLKTPTILEQLLEEINFQRTKEMRQILKDDSGFVMLQGTTYWTDLFVRHFLFQNESTIDCDDLLFFVRKKHVKGSPRYLPKFETEVDVFRKDSRKLPIGDPDIDWEETVYLNLIIHQFEYTLTLAICTRTSPKELQVLKRHSQKVYASPSRRRMDTKGDLEEITYPHVCFMVDNFDEVFHDILVRDGEMVCVELVAADRAGTIQGVIFLGSIRYDALKKVYDARQSSLSTKMAQRMMFGLFSGSGGNGAVAQRCEFVRMKGPQGKGHAEMAVTKPKGSGVETPTSEPGFCATDLFNEDDDEGWRQEEFCAYRMQRRLSDPSANLNNFVRGGWKSAAATRLDVKSRSENEGLDCLDNGVSEIEAGDLRDERSGPASSAPVTICCGCFQKRKRGDSITLLEMYQRGGGGGSSGGGTTSCCHHHPPRAPLGPPENNNCCVHVPLSDVLAQQSEYEVDRDRGTKVMLLKRTTKKKKNAKGSAVPLPPVPSRSLCTFNSEFEVADDAISLNGGDKEEGEDGARPSSRASIRSGTTEQPYINVNGTEELPEIENNRLNHISKSNKNSSNMNNSTNTNDTGADNEANNKRLFKTQLSVVDGNYNKLTVKGIYSYCTLPKNNAKNKKNNINNAKQQKRRQQQPPKRITPDGTHIYYWCDMNKRNNELDDGAYNPLWTMRGFTQTFHFWKENKRAQSVPLNAFLTYVTLPWWSIAKGGIKIDFRNLSLVRLQIFWIIEKGQS